MYTPFELQKIANRASIKANPFDYSLNNKIILNDTSTELSSIDFARDARNLATNISSKIYPKAMPSLTEQEAQEEYENNLEHIQNSFIPLISEIYSKISHEPMPTIVDKTKTRLIYEDIFARFASFTYRCKFTGISNFGSPYNFIDFKKVFTFNSSYYLRLKHLDSSLQDLDSFALQKPHLASKATKEFDEKELEALFTLNLHLKNSIIHPLSYMLITEKYTYAELRAFKNIKNLIKDLDKPKGDIEPQIFSFLSAYAFTQNSLEKAPSNMLETTLKSDQLDVRFVGSKESYPHIAKYLEVGRQVNLDSFHIYKSLETFIYYIEVLYIVMNKLDKVHKNLILDLFRINGENQFILDNIYNPYSLTFSTEVEEIINEHDSESRFNLIKHFITSDSFKTKFINYQKSFRTIINKGSFNTGLSFSNNANYPIYSEINQNHGIPTFIIHLVNAIKELALYQDFENYLTHMISYAKYKKIDLGSVYTTTSKLSDDFAEKLDESASMNPFDVIQFDSNEDGTPKLETETTKEPKFKDPNVLSENLDKLVDSFKENGHLFTIKEVNPSENARNQYAAVASKIKLLNSLLIKEIRQIKTFNQGSKLSNLSHGKLDSKNLYKYDQSSNLFYNNKYEVRESDLAIGVILDASGSMSGEKISDGKVSMVLLHETLRSLNINHSIVDHTARGHHTSIIRRYHDFNESKHHKTSKAYSIMDIVSREGNDDAGALYYMEKALLNTNNKDKICLIFSDGQPTECSELELKEQVKSMERKGIKVIGIGINLPEIANYYSDYANGKNLSDMIKIITKILKQYILDKGVN